MRVFRLIIQISLCVAAIFLPLESGFAKGSAAKQTDPLLKERLQLFLRMESLYGIPWNYLAAIDQYERTMKIRKNKPIRKNRTRGSRLLISRRSAGQA